MGSGAAAPPEEWESLVASHEDLAPRPAFAQPWIVAGFAAATGLAIDTVALHQPPGVGLALGLWLSVIAVAYAPALLSRPVPRSRSLLAGVAMLLAGFVAVRSSPTLVALDVAATIVLVGILSQIHTAGAFERWTIGRYAAHPLRLGGEAVSGATRFLATDLRSGFAPQQRRRVRAVTVGLLVGVPLAAVFGELFASADVTFAAYVDRFSDALLVDEAFVRAAGSLVIAAAVVGVWRTERRRPDGAPRPGWQRRHRLDPTSAVTVMALLVVVFAMFVATQVIGHDPDLVTPGDYARNARSGFFQLLAVATLVLATLLTLDWLIRRPGDRRSRAFDGLAVVLVALTAVVMVSAMNRMRLYVAEFGVTELRLYTSVFMVWLAFVLGWFIATVLRDRHARFAFGMLLSGLGVVLALNVANPDARIVRINWDRHLAGAEFAEDYSATLSADSIPELVLVFGEAGEGQRLCDIEARLVRERADLAADRRAHGVLGDSWSKAAARRALADLGDDLGDAELGCAP